MKVARLYVQGGLLALLIGSLAAGSLYYQALSTSLILLSSWFLYVPYLLSGPTSNLLCWRNIAGTLIYFLLSAILVLLFAWISILQLFIWTPVDIWAAYKERSLLRRVDVLFDAKQNASVEYVIKLGHI